MRDVASRLELVRPRSVFTVAGTNGKGSVVRVIENLLLANGLEASAYTSPHLVRYNERIRISGMPVEDDSLIDACEVVEAARGDVALTYFEFGTLAALGRNDLGDDPVALARYNLEDWRGFYLPETLEDSVLITRN